MHQELYDDSGSDIHLRWIKNDQDELEKLYEKYTELMVSNESWPTDTPAIGMSFYNKSWV